MDGTAFVVLSGTLTFGVPLVIAMRELIELKRRGESGWGDDGSAPLAPKPLPIVGTRPSPIIGTKPLPDCLIPRLAPLPPGLRPLRIRELEEA